MPFTTLRIPIGSTSGSIDGQSSTVLRYDSHESRLDPSPPIRGVRQTWKVERGQMKPRVGGWRRVTLALCSLIIGGCGADTVMPGNCSSQDSRDCREAKRGAQRLLDAHSACAPGDSCKIISASDVVIPCSGIYCSVPVNGRTDEAAFLAQARLLHEQAGSCSRCGDVCPMPTCMPPAQAAARCDAGLGRCILGLR
jgi:hypothetical protein